jgi:hypothetical protein
MNARHIYHALAVASTLVCSTAWAQADGTKPSWQEQFNISSCAFTTVGKNRYFVLEPGFQLVLEGGDTKLQITVLDETKTVDGVLTRVVEERGWEKGELHEVARNYYALCEQSKDIFYFGEDVDYYKKGKVVSHEGTWLAGVDGNRAGLMMPGTPKTEMRFYQELARGVSMDRAEIISLKETCKTPAGTFHDCLKVKEGSALEPTVTEYKFYAPEIGYVGDGELRLIKYGSRKGS